MTFGRVNALGWGLFELLTSGQMNALDINVTNALDGLGGGPYNPTAPIVLDAVASSGHALSIISAANGGLHVQVDAGPVGQLIDGTADAVGLRVAQGPISDSAVTPQNSVEVVGIGNDDLGGVGGVAINAVGGATDGATGGTAILATGGTTIAGGSSATVGGHGVEATGGAAGLVGGHGVKGTGGTAVGGGSGVFGKGGGGDGVGVEGEGTGAGAGGYFDGGTGSGTGVVAFGGDTGNSSGLIAIGGANGKGAEITGLGTAVGAEISQSAHADDIALDLNGGIDFERGSEFATNPASTSRPNVLFGKNVVKAWALIIDGVVTEAWNIDTCVVNGVDDSRMLVTFEEDMSADDYIVIATSARGFASFSGPRFQNMNFGTTGEGVYPTNSAFQLQQRTYDGGHPPDGPAIIDRPQSDSECHLIVMGKQ